MLLADVTPPMPLKMLCLKKSVYTLIFFHHERINHRHSLFVHIPSWIHLVDVAKTLVNISEVLPSFLPVSLVVLSIHQRMCKFRHLHAVLSINAMLVQTSCLISLALATIFNALQEESCGVRTIALRIFISLFMRILANHVCSIGRTHKLPAAIHHQRPLHRLAKESLCTINDGVLIWLC